MIAERLGGRGFRPVLPVSVAIVAAAVALVTWASAPSALPAWMPPRWAETNAIPRDATLLVAPLLAAVGAWMAGRLHTMALGPVPARPRAQIVRGQLGPLLLASVVGGVLGVLPHALRTARDATAGGVDPAVLVSGWAGAIALLVLGYLAGALWRSRMVVVVAAVATWPLLVAPSLLTDAFAGNLDTGTAGTSFQSVALVWLDFDAGPGWRDVTGTALMRVLLFAAFATAAALAATSWLAGDRSRGRLAQLVPFVVPVGFAAVMLVQQPVLVTAETEEACDTAAGTTVCVSADIARQLPAVRTGASAVVAAFGPGALTPDVEAGTPLTDVVGAPLMASEADTAGAAIIATARGVAGVQSCSLLADDGELSSGGAYYAAASFAGDLAVAVASAAGAPDELVAASMPVADEARVRELVGSDPAVLATFLHDHVDGLRACREVALRP